MIGELHLLEQMSSDEHLGSLAEAVLEAVRENPKVTYLYSFIVSQSVSFFLSFGVA